MDDYGEVFWTVGTGSRSHYAAETTGIQAVSAFGVRVRLAPPTPQNPSPRARDSVVAVSLAMDLQVSGWLGPVALVGRRTDYEASIICRVNGRADYRWSSYRTKFPFWVALASDRESPRRARSPARCQVLASSAATCGSRSPVSSRSHAAAAICANSWGTDTSTARCASNQSAPIFASADSALGSVSGRTASVVAFCK